MVRKLVLIVLFSLLINSIGISQENRDLGVQAGGSYYLGDYNQGIPLYKPSPSIGLIFRYNLNKYYALRLSANYSNLKGDYSSVTYYLPGITNSFSKQIVELEGLYEINFMSFTTRHFKKDNFSPYVILGVGGAYIGGDIIPHLPFGVGLKYCPISRVTVGWEWRVSKTFSDNIDDYKNVYDGSKAIFHNNDWFSFVGLFITFRLYNNKNTCPVYE